MQEDSDRVWQGRLVFSLCLCSKFDSFRISDLSELLQLKYYQLFFLVVACLLFYL